MLPHPSSHPILRAGLLHLGIDCCPLLHPSMTSTSIAPSSCGLSLLRWSSVIVMVPVHLAECLEEAISTVHVYMARILEMIPGRFILTIDGAPVGPLWFGSLEGATSYAQAEYGATSSPCLS